MKRGEGPNSVSCRFHALVILGAAVTGRTGEAPAHNQLFVILAVSLAFVERQLGWEVCAALCGGVHVAKAKPELSSGYKILVGVCRVDSTHSPSFLDTACKMPTYSRLTPSWRGYTRIKKIMVL